MRIQHRARGDFVERGSQTPRVRSRRQWISRPAASRASTAPERGGVADDGCVEFQPFAHGEDGDAVRAQVAAHDHGVAGAHRLRSDSERMLEHTDAGGVDEDAVGFAFVDNLGVAGDQRDSGARGAWRMDRRPGAGSRWAAFSRMKPALR